MRLSVVSIMSDCYVAMSIVDDSSMGRKEWISFPKTLKGAAWECHVGVIRKRKRGKQAGENRWGRRGGKDVAYLGHPGGQHGTLSVFIFARHNT